MEDKMILDTEHWQRLKPPLAPNEHEVRLYEEFCRGRSPICLLGMTKELIGLCDYMVDLNPIEQQKRVIKSDWTSFEERAEAVIGDGVLNLAGLGLVERILGKCERLMCRVFLKKLNGMKYATHFPTSFPGAKTVVETQPDVAIVTWHS